MENRLNRHNGEEPSAGSIHKPAKCRIRTISSPRDALFLGILAALAVAFLLWFLLGYQKLGLEAEITVDGALYGTYPLDENREIPIETEGITTNVLVIEDGKADMIRADCPDKICVHQAAVSHVGETIVCLPNRVVVTVRGEEEPQFDSVVK